MQIRPPLHVCLRNSVARPSFKILSGHLVKMFSPGFLKDGHVTELSRETCKGGMILVPYLASTLKHRIAQYIGYNII